jgi:NAD(P)-dependent dehydrogenase (short-subunit alcohol dehydrogenase family)
MAESHCEGIIINQFLMPMLFADHPLAAALAAARGANSSLTRVTCGRFGRAGVRVVGLAVGLLNLLEVRSLASKRVYAATTPLGRWIEPEDVAETVAFRALESGYIAGQMLVLDGRNQQRVRIRP